MATKAELENLQTDIANTGTGLEAVGESARLSGESAMLDREAAEANKEVITGLKEVVAARNPTGNTTVRKKRKYTYTDEKTGDLIDVFEDDTEEVRTKGTKIADAQKAAEATAAERLAGKVSAFDILRREFKANGLEFLVTAAENAIMNEETEAGRILALRNSPAYVQRFSANEQRKLKGLTVLNEASYLALEDQYQEVMRQYGLPASYYAKDATGKQIGFEQLIANDVSNVELGDRLMAAQDRVLKANPEVLQALKSFYPDIKNGDMILVEK